MHIDYFGRHFQAEFVETSDFRWKRVLERAPHDFYHYPEYVKLAAKHEGGHPLAFYAENGTAKFLIPMLIKKVPAWLEAPDDWCDALSPYGYPSPIFTPPIDSTLLGLFMGIFCELALDRGIIAGFYRLHPLLRLPLGVLKQYGTLVSHGQTVYIDTTKPIETLVSQTRHGHQADIRRLIKDGFRVEMDAWERFDAFKELYQSSMDRVAASDYYRFSDSYFDDLRLAIGDHLHLCTVVSPNGQIAAGGLFTKVGKIAQYHLSGTADDYLCRAPSKLMLDYIRRWASESHCSYFHLGGGVGCQRDSLFDFKAGFSGERAEFHTYRMIFDREKYNLLVRRWMSRTAFQGETPYGYFPAYRTAIGPK